MTFEEWWYENQDDLIGEYAIAQAAWEARVPEGYVLVPVDELKQIEDAIAFELGGEPCGLHIAHDLVKRMIQASQESECPGVGKCQDPGCPAFYAENEE